jgi:fucose permease
MLAVVSANRLALVLSLVPFGFCNGLIDVSMNSQAAAFEQRTKRPVMSSFHAFYSLGGLLGTLFGAALLAANISPSTHVMLAFVFFLTEGAIYDWSGVFLRTALGVDLSAELIGLQKALLLVGGGAYPDSLANESWTRRHAFPAERVRSRHLRSVRQRVF